MDVFFASAFTQIDLERTDKQKQARYTTSSVEKEPAAVDSFSRVNCLAYEHARSLLRVRRLL
jgi:hypothetical protein